MTDESEFAEMNDPYQRLLHLEHNYRGVRGHVQQLLPEVIQIARDAIEVAEAQAKTRINQAEIGFNSTIKYAERRFDQEREERTKAEARYDEIRVALAQKRSLKEERHKEQDEVKITLGKDYSDDWTVEDLEETAWRIRSAGGEDDTSVKLDQYSIRAKVPDPNMVSLDLRNPREPMSPREAIIRADEETLAKRAKSKRELKTVGVIVGATVVGAFFSQIIPLIF